MNRKLHSPDFKCQVALVSTLKGLKTINELGSEYSVHPNQIGQWKKQLQEGAKEIFCRARGKVGQQELVLTMGSTLDFDIQNLGVCVVEQSGPNYTPPKKAFIDDDLLFLPKTNYCEIVEYVEIREVREEDYR